MNQTLTPLKARRKELGLTLMKVSEGAGITKSYLCYLEKGERKRPSLKTVLGLADVLSVEPETAAAWFDVEGERDDKQA